MTRIGGPIGHHNTQNIFIDVIVPLLTLTLPGLLLCAGGLVVSVVSFGGFASIVFRVGASHGNIELPGPILPSAVPLAAAYFVGFAGGGILAAVGGSMVARSDGTRAARLSTWVTHAAVAVVVGWATVQGVSHVADGVPLVKLLPHFSACPGELPGATMRNPIAAHRRTVTIDEWVCTPPRKTPPRRRP